MSFEKAPGDGRGEGVMEQKKRLDFIWNRSRNEVKVEQEKEKETEKERGEEKD